ncbi:MAG: hypothetical protein ACJA06_000612 [Halocynthiibacter sp.]|jgi:hypothetical protein
MAQHAAKMTSLLLASCLALSACSGGSPFGKAPRQASAEQEEFTGGDSLATLGSGESSFLDLFGKQSNPNTDVGVSKYIWTATLDVLGFLPVRNADPFTGVIITGYGTPPGGGRAYRATVYISDPALDARSLNLSLYTKGGAASPATVRAVEDAILTRARQLRSGDAKL